ncbi:hypothetical protein E3N88_39694 [Mikania micrantha]|uniref:Uncharacterized protein n=1 Tax=Mikania micrantha TaxID=192012 RepID=A0A5N6LKQ4_9ASTR|nr:hypothetical protein E3N88_39694 [Mikania micrantha]
MNPISADSLNGSSNLGPVAPKSFSGPNSVDRSSSFRSESSRPTGYRNILLLLREMVKDFLKLGMLRDIPVTPATSSSSEDQINIKQNIDKNSQLINATMKTPLQTSFSYSVSRLFSSLTEDYSLITCQRSMRTVLSLTTQLEFDFQKEMEMLKQ